MNVRHGDVLYVVGPEGDNDHEELRYSLRSLAAHVNHNQVWIAGHCPTWVADVWHIDIHQYSPSRTNARRNLAAAITQPELSDPFMLWCDDIFAMMPVGDLPVLHRGLLTDVVDEARGDYHTSLAKTYRELRKQGIRHPLAFDALHTPQWFNKAPLAEVLATGVPMYATAYGNLHRRHPGTAVPNAKSPLDYRDRAWVSTNTPMWESEIGEYVRAAFPDPCRYEAD